MRLHRVLPGILGVCGILIFSLQAKAAELESWQFSTRKNELTFRTDETVQPRIQLITNPDRLVIDLPDTTLGEFDTSAAGEDGIRAVRVSQLNTQTARIVVELEPGYTIAPEAIEVDERRSATRWTIDLPDPVRASASSSGQAEARSSQIGIPTTPPSGRSLSVQAVELADEGNQVLIQADQPIAAYIGAWDGSTYRITLPNARLSSRVVQTELQEDSALQRLLVRQEGSRVVVQLQPTPGVEIGQITPLTGSILALALEGKPQVSVTPPTESSTPPLPTINNTRIVVAIDPGHGGRDPGAVGIGGLRETDIVLPIALRVSELLEQQGVQVVLTRQDEREIDLEPRVRTANRANANIFVSIHANAISMSRPDVNGAETFYYSTNGQVLAQTIQNSIIRTTGMNDRGARFARFYVLRYTSMPAALVEVGFVTGREDAARLADPAFRDQMAEGITRGILQYLQQNR